MTLREEVLKIMEENGINQKIFAEICGINRGSVSKLIHTGYISNMCISKIEKVYKKGFEKYYLKKVCELCGEEFITLESGWKYCGRECSSIMNKKKITELDKRKREMRNAAGETKAERYKWRAKVRPPKVSIVEFMSGEQYGDRQKQYLLSLQKEQRMEIR